MLYMWQKNEKLMQITLATTLGATFATTLALTGVEAFTGSDFFPKLENNPPPAFATGAGALTSFFTGLDPPLNISSKGEGGIFDPGQLNEGIALI